VARQVGVFALAGLAAVALVAWATWTASRRVGEREGIVDARTRTLVIAQGLVEPAVTAGLERGNAAAVETIERVVEDEVLRSEDNASLVRVKIWARDGRIVYSDEPRLQGERYRLDAEAITALDEGLIEAEVGDLSKPENRYEREHGKLLEVYLPIRTPNDESRLLFEAYYDYGIVEAASSRIWRSFAPISFGALIALELVQIPIALSLAHRLRQRQREREGLLQRAIDASEVERRRIASDLHDGVVQDLAGVAYSLAGAARRDGVETPTAELLDQAAGDVRSSIRALRSLLVEIYPPNLHEAGLAAALTDLTAGRRGARRARRARRRRVARAAPPTGRRAAVPRDPGDPAQRRRARAGELRHRARRQRLRACVGDGDRRRCRVRPRRRGGGRRERALRSGGLARARGGCGRHGRGALRAGRGHDGTGGGAVAMIRVLIVDDHAVVRRGLEQLVSSAEDLEVVGAAGDGEEAVRVAQDTQPDVVLMDLSMPGVDGVEATRRIVEGNPDVHVVVLTSFAEQQRVMDALEAGAVGYLLKDADPDDVVSGIRAAHAGGSPLDPKVARVLLDARRAGRPQRALSAREEEVLRLVANGLANKQIARRLGISERTVKAHLTSVFQQLGVTDRTQAALWAREHLPPE
jgi:DNA-binding NarL/FixJ family response regulator/signal transduction histidine kinase